MYFGLIGYNTYRSRYERNAILCENNKKNVKELNNQARNKKKNAHYSYPLKAFESVNFYK